MARDRIRLSIVVTLLTTCALQGGCGVDPRSSDMPREGQRVSINAIDKTELSRLFSEMSVRDGGGYERFRFRLDNGTNNPAKVSVHSKSCSCLDAGFVGLSNDSNEEARIEPHADVIFEMRIDLRREPGKHRGSVDLLIEFPDGHSEEHKAVATVELFNDFNVEPPVIKVDVPSDVATPTARTVYVNHRWRTVNRSAPEVRVSSSAKWVKPGKPVRMGLAEEIAPGIAEQRWRLELTCDGLEALASRAEKAIRTTVLLDSSVFVASEGRSFPVIAERSSGLIVPTMVHFGSIEVGTKLRRRVLIRSADERSFSILDAASDDNAIDITFDKGGPSQSTWLNVWYRPRSVGELRGVINVVTNHPVETTFSIDVRGRALELQGEEYDNAAASARI
jgi:hypothetical protein